MIISPLWKLPVYTYLYFVVASLFLFLCATWRGKMQCFMCVCILYTGRELTMLFLFELKQTSGYLSRKFSLCCKIQWSFTLRNCNIKIDFFWKITRSQFPHTLWIQIKAVFWKYVFVVVYWGNWCVSVACCLSLHVTCRAGLLKFCRLLFTKKTQTMCDSGPYQSTRSKKSHLQRECLTQNIYG